ncbi:MAG: hypothetical protein ABJB74_15570 [Gemmatimonas sp.]
MHASITASDSLEARERLLVSISEFQVQWQQAWRDGEIFRRRTKRLQQQMRPRLPFLHCHNDGRDFGASDGRVGLTKFQDDSVVVHDYLLIEMISANSRYAVCPTWLMSPSVEQAQDESVNRDGALIDSLRAPVKQLRARLLNELDSTARVFPSDGWITGQRARFYLDQEDVPSALAAATSCKGERWWCEALLGYVNARTNVYWSAESLFVEMRKVMPREQRCAWEDLRNLLPPDERKTYADLSCDARMATNVRLWWLADPLLRTRTNERFVENEVRRVEIALRTSVSQDERFTWVAKDGGDVVAQMVERYGWPNYTAWAGYDEDTNHTSYLESFKSPPMTPYTTFEYSLGSVHTIPTWAAIADPFSVADSNWTLRKETAKGQPATNWWPVEHYRPERPIVQLPEGQTAMFRRQSQAVVAVAVRINHPAIVRENSDKRDAMLLTTISPGKVDSLALSNVKAGETAALHGLVDSKPRIMAVESQGPTGDSPDGRTRFAVRPPPPLDSMKRGELAVSDPALLIVDDKPLPNPSEDLLDRMLGTVHLDAKTRRIGVYWETYGISAMDTVTVYVRIVADAQLSTLRRIGMGLNVAANPNREIVQKWTEPDAQRGTRTLDGPIPVQMRAITLNLSQLQPGPYVLEVGLERKDGAIASGSRRIVIEP